MIKANELRIGNILSDGRGGTRTVTEIHENYYSQGVDSILLRDAQGEPLTDFWLERFGFKNKGPFINKVALPGSPSGDMDGAMLFQMGEYGQEVYSLDNKYHFQIDSHMDDYGESITTKTIDFVHQLQNTYLELIEDELELLKAEGCNA